MNGCQGNTSACDGIDLLPVSVGLRRLLVMCAPCRQTAIEMGAHVVERRIANVPREGERRTFRPAWLRNRTAKVLDHGAAA